MTDTNPQTIGPYSWITLYLRTHTRTDTPSLLNHPVFIHTYAHSHVFPPESACICPHTHKHTRARARAGAQIRPSSWITVYLHTRTCTHTSFLLNHPVFIYTRARARAPFFLNHSVFTHTYVHLHVFPPESSCIYPHTRAQIRLFSWITLYLHTHTRTGSSTGSFLQNMTVECDSDLFLTDVFGANNTTTCNKLCLQVLPRALCLLMSETRYSRTPT
jgi:hypothetical protein